MSLIRVDVETIVVGGGPMVSLVVLKPRSTSETGSLEPLPIRLGVTEAASIGMGIENPMSQRPMTHDLFHNVLKELGVTLSSVVITGVEGTTFYATLNLVTAQGERLGVDSRPSDAIALALHAKAPIFVDEEVLRTASCPDFEAVRRDENQKSIEEFRAFLENLSPDDFLHQK